MFAQYFFKEIKITATYAFREVAAETFGCLAG